MLAAAIAADPAFAAAYAAQVAAFAAAHPPPPVAQPAPAALEFDFESLQCLTTLQLIQLGCTAAQAALLLQTNPLLTSPEHDSLDGFNGNPLSHLN